MTKYDSNVIEEINAAFNQISLEMAEVLYAQNCQNMVK